jgi:hypothetical protein
VAQGARGQARAQGRSADPDGVPGCVAVRHDCASSSHDVGWRGEKRREHVSRGRWNVHRRRDDLVQGIEIGDGEEERVTRLRGRPGIVAHDPSPRRDGALEGGATFHDDDLVRDGREGLAVPGDDRASVELEEGLRAAHALRATGRQDHGASLHPYNLLALLPLVLGCTHHPPENLVVVPNERRIAVHIEAVFHTVATRGSERISSLEPWMDTACTLDTTISLTPSRTFRDGSLGSVLRFEEAALTTKNGQPLPLTLAGRTVELRRFPDGEILDVDLADHVIASDRLLGVFDLLFPLVSPFPPDLPKDGVKAPRILVWPVLDEKRNGWYQRAETEWTLAGTESLGDRKVFRLEYVGPWTGRGKDAVGTVPVGLTSHGQASGVLWYDATTLDLVAQEFHWRRQVSWTAGRGEAAATVTQDQDFSGRVSVP